MIIHHIEEVIRQIEGLQSSKCFDSAEILCQLTQSSISKPVAGRTDSLPPAKLSKINANLTELYGDIVFAKQEYKRALGLYKQASQFRSATASLRQRTQGLVETPLDASLKYKECLCHVELKENSVAVRELESIPSKLRDLKMNILMGKLYKWNGIKRHAITCYTAAVASNPSTVEAIEALVGLGLGAGEIHSIIDEACRNLSDQQSSIFSDGWLHTLVSGLVHKRNCDQDKCEIQFQSLLSTFPRNCYLLNQLACAAVAVERPNDALKYFRHIRRIDSTIIDCMDQYGLILMESGEDIEVNKLANEILAISAERPEGWLVVAQYCQMKGETEKAMQFVEKAITENPKYSHAFKLKGRFLLEQEHFEQASVAYFQANTLEKDIVSFTGIAEAHLLVNKYKDAINTAKEAIACMPRSGTAFWLMGRVLAQVPQGANEAIRAYKTALKMSPDSVLIAASLAESLLVQEKVEDAIQSLKGVLNRKPSAKLRTLLARALALQEKYGEAVEQLHLAISLHPQDCVEATQELDRIVGLMRQESSMIDVDGEEQGGALYDQGNNQQLQQQGGEEEEEEQYDEEDFEDVVRGDGDGEFGGGGDGDLSGVGVDSEDDMQLQEPHPYASPQ